MRIKLPVKIILSVVLVQAFMLLLIVVNSVRLINTSHESIIEQYIRETNQLLSVSLQPGLISHNPALINNILSLVEKNQNLVYVSVYDRNEKLLAHQGGQEKTLAGLPQQHDTSFKQALSDNVFDSVHELIFNGKKIGDLHIGYSVALIKQYGSKTSRQNTLLAVIGLVFSIGVAILLGIVLTRNLRILEEGALALEQGQLDHRIKLDSNDEISDVAQSINKLAQHLQKTQSSLQDERLALEKEANRLETLLNGVNAVLLEVDPDTNDFIYVSEGGHELLGYPVEQWLQPGFWINHIHPEEHEWVIKTILQHNQQPGDYTLDYRMLNNQGEFIWVRSIHSIDF
ncbi:MAG: PAS domain-containing protein, partial [Gammaproteobacteria bacterium]